MLLKLNEEKDVLEFIKTEMTGYVKELSKWRDRNKKANLNERNNGAILRARKNLIDEIYSQNLFTSDPFDLWLMCAPEQEDCDCIFQEKPHLWLRFGLADYELISSSGLFSQGELSVRSQLWRGSPTRNSVLPIPLYWFGHNCLFNEEQFEEVFPKNKNAEKKFDENEHIDNLTRKFWVDNEAKIETMQDILLTFPPAFDSDLPRCYEWVSYVLTSFQKMEGGMHTWTPNFSSDGKLSKVIKSLIESVSPHSHHPKKVEVVSNRLLKSAHWNDMERFYSKIECRLNGKKFPQCRFLHAAFLQMAKEMSPSKEKVQSFKRLEFFSKAFSFLPTATSPMKMEQIRQSIKTLCGQTCAFCSAIANPLNGEFKSLQDLCQHILSESVLKSNLEKKYRLWIQEIMESKEAKDNAHNLLSQCKVYSFFRSCFDVSFTAPLEFRYILDYTGNEAENLVFSMIPEFGNNHLGLSMDFVRIDWYRSRQGPCVVIEFIDPELWNPDAVDLLPGYWMNFADYSELFRNDCHIDREIPEKKDKGQDLGQQYLVKSYMYRNDNKSTLNPTFKLLRNRKNLTSLDVFNVDMHLFEPVNLGVTCTNCKVKPLENCIGNLCSLSILKEITGCDEIPQKAEELAKALSTKFYQKNADKFAALSKTLGDALTTSINAQHCQDFVSKVIKFINRENNLMLPKLWGFSDWQLQEYMNILRDSRWKKGIEKDTKKLFPVYPSQYVVTEKPLSPRQGLSHQSVFRTVHELVDWLENSKAEKQQCQYYFSVLKYMLISHEVENDIFWKGRLLCCEMFAKVSIRIMEGEPCKFCSEILKRH
jgi:hypothetical protein